MEMNENDLSALPEPPLYANMGDRPRPGNVSNAAQSALINAMLDGETDAKKLATISGMGRAADVFAAIDRLTLRREFHAALARSGLDLDVVTARLRKIIDNEDDEVALKGISVLLKSIGLEKNDEPAPPAAGWEEAVFRAAQGSDDAPTDAPYEVIEPPMPESLRKLKDKERVEAEALYE